MKKKTDNFEISSEALINAGRMGTNLMGAMGNPVGGVLEVAGAKIERDKLTTEAANIFDDDIATLKIDNPLFKRHVKDTLSSLEVDRVTGFGFSLAGSAIAIAVVSALMGPPGWIMGLVVAGAGGIGANLLKDQIWPSDYNQFTRFASGLQTDAQQGTLSAEKAFVASVVTMLDKHDLKEVFASLPKVKSEGDLIKLLDTQEGMEALHHAMLEHDQLIRSAIGAVNIMPNMHVSQQLAQIANNRQIGGIDLLSVERLSHLGTMIGVHDMQQQSMPQASAEHAPMQNPNQNLPNLKSNQLSV